MRYKELIANQKTTEGRSWNDSDDLNLLQDQIKRADNIRAFYVYAPEVHITNAVKFLAMRRDCKWFFDFMTTKLHVLDTQGVDALIFCMHKHGDELHAWARDDFDNSYAYPVKSNQTFPLDSVELRAVHEGNFWHVSFGGDSYA